MATAEKTSLVSICVKVTVLRSLLSARAYKCLQRNFVVVKTLDLEISRCHVFVVTAVVA